MYDGKQNCKQGLVRNPEVKYHMEDLDVDGKKILKYILNCSRGMEWDDLAKDGDDNCTSVK